MSPNDDWCSLCHVPVGGVPVQAASAEPSSREADRIADPIDADPIDADPSESSAEASLWSGPGADAEPRRELKPEAAVVADRLLADLALAESVARGSSRLESLQTRLGATSPRTRGVLLAGAGGVLLLLVSIFGLTVIGLLL